MGKKSTKENKNIYQQSREAAGLTRADASELLGYISESTIWKIENEKATVQPEDVVAMAEAYKNPSLCNYYCSHECRIGQEYVPEIKIASLAEISLSVLASVNSLNQQKERLIEITADGSLTEDELSDFLIIKNRLDTLAQAANTLSLWMEHAVAEGEFDKDIIEGIKEKLGV